MKTLKGAAFYLVLPLVAAGSLYFAFGKMHTEESSVVAKIVEEAKEIKEDIKKSDELPFHVILGVPYVSEAPEGIWAGPWKNACEEATIAMVDHYYLAKDFVSVAEVKSFMQTLFDAQDRMYGSNANSDAKRTAEIANLYANFKAEIKENPTLEEIKKEVVEGRPVISLHKGFDLGNKNIPFLPTGSSYHTLVVVGYDDGRGVFITHDPGDDYEGKNHEYTYEVFMNSLHDYNYQTHMTDLPPKVLFTSQAE